MVEIQLSNRLMQLICSLGKKKLPPAEDIVKAFFIRKEFIPEPLGTNALFPFFAQHFSHMFFKTDLKKGPQFQWGGHGV